MIKPLGSTQKGLFDYKITWISFSLDLIGSDLRDLPDCLKGCVVCGTVYGDMHLKDLLGSIVRVGYHIPVPDFYQVLHGLRCRKST